MSTTNVADLGKIQFVETAQISNYFPLFEMSLVNYPRSGQSVNICFSPPLPPDIVRVIHMGGKGNTEKSYHITISIILLKV